MFLRASSGVGPTASGMTSGGMEAGRVPGLAQAYRRRLGHQTVTSIAIATKSSAR